MNPKKTRNLIIGGAVVLLLVVWIITTYNSLVKKEEKVKQQWSEVQNTYQRRLDLVPSIVNVVKGVSGFEQGTLEKIAEARADALRGTSNAEMTQDNYKTMQKVQDTMASAMNRLIIQVENYPTLKGTDAYAGLQTQLEGTERRIKVARSDFNEAIADYNKKVRGFPTNIIAGLLGFKKRTGFEAEAGTEQTVEIKIR